MRKSIIAMGIAIMLLPVISLSVLAEKNPYPKEVLVGGFAIGPQSYSFNKFTFTESLEKAKKTGSKVMEFYPGQKFSKENPAGLDHNADKALWDQAKKKAAETGILLVNYGVVNGKDENEIKKIFEFAKYMGLKNITIEPAVELLDVYEKLAKETKIRVGIHNHPGNKNNPNYKWWDPNFVLENIKNRDKLIGAAVDTGHWMTSEINPVDGIKILSGRIVSAHLKDKNEMGEKGHDVPYGEGKGEVKQILDALKAMDFNGNIAIEYEYNWDANDVDIAKCIGFVKTYGETKKAEKKEVKEAKKAEKEAQKAAQPAAKK